MNLAEGLAIVAGSRPGGTILSVRKGRTVCCAAVATDMVNAVASAQEAGR